MENILIAQIFGILAVIFFIISTQKNTKGQILIYNGLANAMAAIQYVFLNAWTGVISMIIAILRNIVFSRYKQVPLYILIIYLVIAIGFNLTLYDGILSLVPMIKIVIYAIGIYQKDVKVLKIIMLISCIISIAYDAINLAIVSMINQVISSIAGIIGLIRHKDA